MNQSNSRIKIMRETPILQALLKLAIPTMVGMLVSALYNVVDTYFVSGLGTSEVGAVSIVFPISQIITGLAMTFGSGAASYISRLLGKGEEKSANTTASTALFTSLAIGVIAIAVSLIFLNPILQRLGATDTILPHARSYAIIFIGGSIFNIFNVTMNNLVTSEGATKLTMSAMLIGGILNCILDPIFIYPLNFGVAGAAIATVISQAVTSIMYLWFILKKKGVLRISLKFFKPNKVMYGEIFKVGIPTLVFQILSSTAIGLTNTAASNYGDSAVAAMGVVTRILTLGSYVIFGYMKGFQPLAGYNYGAKQYDRLKSAIRTSLIWSTCFCIIAGLLLICLAPNLISVFSQNDSAMIEIGSNALQANGATFALFGLQMVYSSTFLALGRGIEGSVLSISRQGIFFIPAILLLPTLLGLDGVLYAQPIADVLTTLLTLIFALKITKELKGLHDAPTSE
ncbi:MAG: MATE family efflux transporter [Lachnospiraceae bacterium]